MYRGWLQLDGAELVNTSRTVAHARPGTPATMEEALAACKCPTHYVRYDDSWVGLRDYLGQPPYLITNAPWYDPAVPQSAEFLGYWVTSVEGDGPTPVARTANDAICAGGVATPHRDTHRSLRFEAQLVACSNAGVEYGMQWLACQLRPAKGLRGTTLDYLDAHPGGSAATPALLARRMNRVVLLQEPRRQRSWGNVGADNRQGSLYTIDWQLGVMDPYTYGPATTETVVWDTTVVEGITWAHPPNCQNPASCDEVPVLASVTCVPNVVDIRPVQPPVCSGCTPICDVETRTWVVPDAGGVLCSDQVIVITVTAGAEPVSANFWFRPCGVTDLCERTGFLTVAGLPAGATVVADSMSGRAYSIIDGVQRRQVAIITTPSGAPWTATVLDKAECWELVAQHEPGLDYTVQVEVRGRE